MNYFIQALFVSNLFFATACAQFFLLKSPTPISPEQVEQLPHFWSPEFGDRSKVSVHFLYLKGNTAVKLYSNNNGTYCSPLWDALENEMREMLPSPESSYYIDTPRLLQGLQNPKRLM